MRPAVRFYEVLPEDNPAPSALKFVLLRRFETPDFAEPGVTRALADARLAIRRVERVPSHPVWVVTASNPEAMKIPSTARRASSWLGRAFQRRGLHIRADRIVVMPRGRSDYEPVTLLNLSLFVDSNADVRRIQPADLPADCSQDHFLHLHDSQVRLRTTGIHAPHRGTASVPCPKRSFHLLPRRSLHLFTTSWWNGLADLALTVYLPRMTLKRPVGNQMARCRACRRASALLTSFGLLALLLPIFSWRCAALEAGVARVDLTPPLEMNASLGGYGERRSRPATGVRDRVWVKALVLRGGSERRAIVTGDLLALPPGFRDAVASLLATEGWRASDLLLLASHSHTSLDLMALNPKNTFQIPELGLFQKQVADWAVARFADAVRRAAASPMTVTAGSAASPMDGWNRNRRRGPAVDRELALARFDTETGKPLAVLVNWTAHPTFMGPEHMEFSGDWPGHLQRTLEALIGQGVTVLFSNGAEGDQSPTPRLSGAPAWEQAESYGRDLAIEAWRIWQTIRPVSAPVFAWHVEGVDLPPRSAHADFMRTGGKEYGLTADNIGLLLEALCPTQSHCTAVRLGDLVVVGVPGEMAAGLGLEVKTAIRNRTGARHVMIGGLADEWISYMLQPDEYRKGGYEASVSFYGETLGPMIVRTAVAAGKAVW